MVERKKERSSRTVSGGVRWGCWGLGLRLKVFLLVLSQAVSKALLLPEPVGKSFSGVKILNF